MSLNLPPVQAANKYITTDANGQPVAVYDVDLAITDVSVVANQAARLALSSAQKGDVAIQSDTGKTYILATNSPSVNGDWKEVLAFGAQTATTVAFTPAGTIAASTVQAAVEEVATDAAALVTGHTSDASAAHAASAIAVTPAGSIAATEVQAALEEVATDAAALVSDHTGDTSAAHAASAIAVTPAGTIAATEVQAALEEIASEAANADNLTSGTVPDARMPAELTPLLTLGSALQQIRVNAGGT